MRLTTRFAVSLAALAGLAACVSTPAPASRALTPPAAYVADIKPYDRAAWSRTETLCDRLAAHPDDPEKVSPGVAQSAMDIPAAIAACDAAVKADPGSPRLNYQLARAYGYAGRHAEGAPFRRVGVMAGYPQSLFVFGFIQVTGWGGSDKDVCTGAELIRMSALAGRKAGLFGFPSYVVNATFEGCAVRQDRAEMMGFLDRAQPMAQGYYEQLLLENLRARVAATP